MRLAPVVARVALLNLAYFGVEFSVALAIGSVSLFADSIDFLEDTSINFLILLALGWNARQRSHVGMATRPVPSRSAARTVFGATGGYSEAQFSKRGWVSGP